MRIVLRILARLVHSAFAAEMIFDFWRTLSRQLLPGTVVSGCLSVLYVHVDELEWVRKIHIHMLLELPLEDHVHSVHISCYCSTHT